MTLTRDEAYNLVESKIKRKNIVKHMLAVEAIMKSLAEYFGEDKEIWGLTGLLHDVDFEEVGENFSMHGLKAEEILKGLVPDEVIQAIKAHNYEYTGVQPKTRMEKALIAADAVSGLLVACALVMPSKKLEEVKISTLNKKFKQKDFARNVDRNRINFCEEIGLSREKFFEIALNGLKKISQTLGI
ncbi:HDIG domain-containing protein [Candidatus Bathyarchaeota archaeon]|nr:MAG: HDIG domain-containing protein [Candidatus Bathyarchaeota archaeon]